MCPEYNNAHKVTLKKHIITLDIVKVGLYFVLCSELDFLLFGVKPTFLLQFISDILAFVTQNKNFQ
jgi:hypothetical protein